jgi:hypothetical protein
MSVNEKIDTTSMHWGDIKDISCYTKNCAKNKGTRSKIAPEILLGAIQFVGNYIKGIKQLNAYESASIIKSDSTWLQKYSFTKYLNKDKKEVKIDIGQVCYLDYGKAYNGELAYYHYGLCISKKEGKILFIPITSGAGWVYDCYHPTKNPNKSKKNRTAYEKEGFSKDCVLMINDAKFLSAGRISELDVKIEDTEVLHSIQNQLFSVCFPTINVNYSNEIKNNVKLKERLNDKDTIIKDLKSKVKELELQLSCQQNKESE